MNSKECDECIRTFPFCGNKIKPGSCVEFLPQILDKIIIPPKPDLNKMSLESKLETLCKASQEQSTCRIPDEMVCSLCAYDSPENYKKFKE